MTQTTITFEGKEYIARVIEPLQTNFRNGSLDGKLIAERELSDAIDKAFERAKGNFESDEYADAENVSGKVYAYVENGYLKGVPTDTELLWEVMHREMTERDFDDQLWYELMRMATYEISLMYESGKINMNCESYACGDDYCVYAYSNRKRRVVYYGCSAQSAAMAAMGVLTAISLTL